MACYITHTTSFLPGSTVDNDNINRFLGKLDGEEEISDQILKMNGIKQRYYAQDENQRASHDVYDLGKEAVSRLSQQIDHSNVTYLSAGTTFSPLAAPGYSSLLHSRLSDAGVIKNPVEISSNAGICSSSSTALISAVRAIKGGDHKTAICVGAEHASEVLKASKIKPVDDRKSHRNLRNSQWFMSVFLRFMLSDGAGAFLLKSEPNKKGFSLRVDWTDSLSFANQAPLCMKLENKNSLLSQNVSILSKYLFPSAETFVQGAFEKHNDSIDAHQMVLPHMSSFFFRRKMERVIANGCKNHAEPTPYWTNLATAGNTGAASIYVMLDEYLKNHKVRDGDRLLLFVPESGQFNFVLISLTAVLS